jgi:protein O-mannosyl-transferase
MFAASATKGYIPAFDFRLDPYTSNPMGNSEVKFWQGGESLTMIVVAAGSALMIFLAFAFLAGSPKSQLNIIQGASLIVFTTLILRHGRTGGASLSERCSEPPANGVRWELLLAPILSAGVYASALSSYFIGDDYAHLFILRLPIFETLAELAKEGQASMFFRPAGFATLFLDYRVWGHEPFGYHLTNLLLHLISVIGVYFLCRNLGLDNETSAVSSLVFSILPIQPEAVVWIASRFDLMATCLIIWATGLYLKFRRTGRRGPYILALLFSFIAMLSKENAFMAPLLLLSLEYFATPKRELRSAIPPLLGFALLAAATFGYRWVALGGIGGYADRNGESAAYKLGFKTIEGLFLRAPSQLLLGINWYAPDVAWGAVLASLAAAVMIVLAFFYRPAQSNKGGIRFCLAWMLIGYLPAHFLTMIGPGLTNSRVLYLSSVGLAILLAVMLSGIELPATRKALKLALILLLSLALSHNVASWRRVGALSRELLTELKELVPDPPPHAIFVFRQKPQDVEGIFYQGALYRAVNLTYNRTDLWAVHEEDASMESVSAIANREGRPLIRVKWLGKPNGLIELVKD